MSEIKRPGQRVEPVPEVIKSADRPPNEVEIPVASHGVVESPEDTVEISVPQDGQMRRIFEVPVEPRGYDAQGRTTVEPKALTQDEVMEMGLDWEGGKEME